MSNKPKIRKPAKNQPAPAQAPAPKPQQVDPLSDDVGSLMTEWRKLRSLIQTINAMASTENEKIVAAQQQIKGLETQGLQAIGQLNIVSRILVGKGIDPEAYAETPVNPAPEAPVAPETPEESEAMAPTPIGGALRGRFNRS